MSYGTPQPGDDAQLRAWRRRYTEDHERTFSLRLPLALARRLRGEAAVQGRGPSRYVADLLRAALGDLPGGPAITPAPPPPVGAPNAPTPDAPPPDARGQVDLRTLRVIQLREDRDGEPHPCDTADRATVLRVLRADLAWVEDTDRRATREASAHD